MNFVIKYFTELSNVLDKISLKQIERIQDILLKAHRNGKCIFILGNGGSAATASHFACDLNKRAVMKVIALTDNVPLLTAWANDTSYKNIFVGQLWNLLEKDDVVIAISASGNSDNVVEAVIFANNKDAVTVGLTGFKGGKLKNIVEACLVIPSTSMEQIENVHLILAHLFSSYLRKVLK